MAKDLKKAKSSNPVAASGKVPKKGGTVVSMESGSRNAPMINIGIERQDRAAIAEGLSRVLADTYTLYLTTHNFHWNVTGPHFNSLHAMFMVQYTELWNSTDVIAERIRALGHYAPGSYAEFSKIATVPDVPQHPPKAMEMVRILVKGHETVSRIAREFIPVSEEAGDDPTADMLTARCTVHDQTAWMLRSLLED
ncbi:ferritin-like domain-containing protein [soil metagenome]